MQRDGKPVPYEWMTIGYLEFDGARLDAERALAPRTCEGGGEAGGSPSNAYLSKKAAKNKNGKRRKRIHFGALLSGIRTPPDTSVRYSYHPPRKREGQGVYPLAYLTCPLFLHSLCGMWRNFLWKPLPEIFKKKACEKPQNSPQAAVEKKPLSCLAFFHFST